MISNRVNGKVYVGQTWRSAAIRFRSHATYNKCQKIHRAIKKYGESSFNIQYIGSTSSQALADYLEQYFIEEYDSIRTGYNIKEGGSRGRHSESSKTKIHEARKRQIITPESIAKMRASLTGRVASPEHRANMSVALKGRICPRTAKQQAKMWETRRRQSPVTEETKQKMSKSMTGFRHSEESKDKMSRLAKARPFRVRPPLTAEHRAKISKALMGRTKLPLTEEHRAKLSEALKGRPKPRR